MRNPPTNPEAPFDNIAISYPEPTVNMSVPANPITPASPTSMQVVTGRVEIANVDETTAAINRRVKLYYRRNGGSWASVDARHETNNIYCAVIPGFNTGTVNYYYRCEFDGYCYFTNRSLRAYYPAGAPAATASYLISMAPTRIIHLVGEGELDFGLVATNIQETLALNVRNDGNSDLAVTNILLPVNFSVDVSNFVLPAGGSTNLNVTFAPTAVQLYGGNIVVESDKTAGTDTIAVTGEGCAAETITTPTVSGPTAATRGVVETYGASASSNYGDPLQYRFAWGDGNTSAWAVALHAWGSTGVYHVTAQAQCTLHPTVVSPWSAPSSVTVTNTRVMRLVGDLAFSPPAVDIGAAPTRTLTVWNDGSDTLLVTNILIAPAAGFTAGPTSFSIAAGGSSNVTVTFTPTAAVAYASTLTLLSDMTTGSNTGAATGTGIDPETVNLLTFTGQTAAALGETLSYVITATNNRGNAMQYRFDWGDGNTSAWASGHSGTHAWSPYGIYAVRGQARSAVDTAVTSLWSSAISLHIQAPPAISITSTNSGLPIPVKVVIPPTNGTVTACTFYCRAPGTAGSSFEGLALTASSTNWIGNLPPLNGGVMTYYVVYELSGVGDVRYPAEPGTLSHTIPSGLTSVGELRFADFTGWSSEADSAWTPGASTTYTNWSKSVVGGQKWLASGARVGAAQTGDSPAGFSGNILGLRSIQGAYLLSPPFDGGVGSIYFTACMRYPDMSAQMTVQIATNANPSSAEWETVVVVDFPLSTPVLQQAVPVRVDRLDAKRVRLLRTDAGVTDTDPYRMVGAIEVDNVAISIPPADLTLDEQLRNPGYPSHDQDVKVRCRLMNSNVNVLAVNQRVTVWYQWGGTDHAGWTNSVAMSLAPALGADVFEGTIPMQPAGKLYYYYRCDFDGYYYEFAPNGSTTNNEQRSPSFLPPSSSTTRPENVLSYEVRQYRSDIDLLEVRADTPQGSVLRGDYQMVLIGDFTWQGVASIKGLTHTAWRFAGVAAYSNDATAFAAGDVYWGEENQDFPNPPFTGYAEANATSSIVAELPDDEQGFLLFRVNTTNGFYIVKRALFQNFDAWPADPRFFERSLGLYGIQTYTNMLTAGTWPAHSITPDDFRAEDFTGTENVEDADYLIGHITSPKGWVFENGRRVLDRAAPVGVPLVSEKNGAVMLDNRADAGFWNSGFALTYGVKNFSFKYRAGLQDNHICHYRAGFSWYQTLKIDASIRAKSMAPSKAFISLVGFFYDAQNYYEARLVQADDTRVGGWTDNQLRIQFVRVVDGVATLLQTFNNGAALSGKLTDSVERRIVFELIPNAPTAGQVRLRAMDGAVAASAWTNSYNDSLPGVLLQGGTAGFNANDAEIQVARVDIAVNGTPVPNASFARFHAGLTDQEKNRWNTQNGRWTFAGSSGDGHLQRLLPTTCSLIVETSAYDPATSGAYGPLPSLWRPVGAPITISNLAAWVTHTVSLERWNKTFVRVRPNVVGDVDLVVDDTYIESWRGRTSDRTQTYESAMEWTTKADQARCLSFLNNQIESHDWALFEGWVADAGGAEGNGAVGNEAQLWRSRANPGLDQAFVSPLLTNGIGAIAFLAWAGRANVRFEVQWSSDPDFVNWEILPSYGEFNLTPGLPPTNISVKIAQTNVQGRIRILHKANSHSNAVLYLDNVVVRDYPPEDNTTWKAYNCLIARPSSENGTLNKAFDGSTIRQSCYLNDSVTNNVLAPDVLDEFYPYVQTPEVDTGLGEISLFYRAWSAAKPGKIIIRKAANQNVAEEAWLEVTNFLVTSETYQRLDMDYFDRTNSFLRLYVDRNMGRVAIDNVLLSEPVRAGFSVLRSWIEPAIPLAGQTVDVYAEIGNYLMNPQGIQVYLDYTAGSNTWGVQHWEALPFVTTIPMMNVSGHVYKSTAQIPGLPTDAIMQYVVRGRHSQLPADKTEHIYQNSFINPTWYYPVDLNTRHQAQGWSPYYYVFSCSTGTVWINEINAYDLNLTGKLPQFIEVCGPASVSLAGWTIIEEERPGTVIPAYSTNQVVQLGGASYGFVTNGIGFLLIGANDPALAIRDLTLTKAFSSHAGGLRLVRSMGAFEECLTYDTQAAPGFGGLAMAQNDPHQRYVYAGYDNDSFAGSLGRAGGGRTAGEFSWLFTAVSSLADWTLKRPNNAQSISDATEIFFWIISVISSHGAQNGASGPLVASVQISQGGSTSIVYTADQWYRIASFETNGIPVGAAAGTNIYTLTITSQQGDQSNHVAFTEWAHPYSGAPLSWLDNWSEAQIAAGDGDSIPIDTEYLLNTDPTANNSYNLEVNSITVVGDTVNVGVALTRSASLGDIHGTLRLYGRDSLTSGGWTLIGSTDVNGATFGAEGNTHTYTYPYAGAAKFYKVVIE